MGNQNDRVRLNVGGKIFETTSTTLAKAGRNSLLGAMFDDNWNLRSDTTSTTTEHFIDRDPDYFSILLNLLRTGELYIPSNLPEKLLYREALFYGLLDQVRSSKWDPFDAKFLRYSQSVTGRVSDNGTAIRASLDGGCCVVQGSMVHVYDWMMEERRPINFNDQEINDVGWVDLDNIVITTSRGMGVFSSSNGKLRRMFNLEYNGKVESYSAGALCFSSDYKIFSSCKVKSSNENSVCVWDQNTGTQIDVFYEAGNFSLGYVNKLQCVYGSNRLLVATQLPWDKDKSQISLFDLRENKMVWRGFENQRKVHDVVVMDDTRTIYVVDGCGKLGFMDLRKNVNGVTWSRSGKLIEEMKARCAKIVFHDGQLLISVNDCVYVVSGLDLVPCSTLRSSEAGDICDLSIGGDRLFALRNEKNVFDIWDTPPTRIM